MKHGCCIIACWAALVPAALAQDSICKDLTYEHRNQVDSRPLRISGVRGIVQDPRNVEIPQACVGIFTESDHKLVLSTCADSKGHFELKGVTAGAYRLVVKVEGFCPANARITLGRGAHLKNSLVAQMRPAGIDTCSWIELK
jgi:hypothetical protein